MRHRATAGLGKSSQAKFWTRRTIANEGDTLLRSEKLPCWQVPPPPPVVLSTTLPYLKPAIHAIHLKGSCPPECLLNLFAVGLSP